MRVNIVPKGIIKSGFANYEVLEGGRKVSYSGEIVYKLGPFKKTQGFNKEINFPTNVLCAEKFKQVGKIEYDRLYINVISCNDSGCEVSFDFLTEPVFGSAILEYQGEIVKIIRANISFGWNGLNFNTELVNG